jgi:hypothetical protein
MERTFAFPETPCTKASSSCTKRHADVDTLLCAAAWADVVTLKFKKMTIFAKYYQVLQFKILRNAY